MEQNIKDLEYAKKAVQSILNDSYCSVDFKGIAYWASEVERLREVIKSNL